MIPLVRVPAGKRVRVVSMAGGSGFVRRLAAMGIVPGAVFDVVQSPASMGLLRGPVIIKRGNLKTGIGWGMASRIMVEVIS